MARDDALRWDSRYRESSLLSLRKPRSFLLEVEEWLPQRGWVLDLAMGLGQNAAFLAERGLRVVGVDISLTALRRAKILYPQVMTICADLEHFSLPEKTFNVVLNFYYLQRSLWEGVRRWLKPGGLLIVETMTQEMKRVKPEIDERYLLRPGELEKSFEDFEILLYWEGWRDLGGEHPRAVASLLARKPEV
ncbi:MAG: class I SAM-dependent methyltransferase [Anaerolineales bacterium]|nr:class I SAM-dependent methyltransferase [Anaerolineales bacterium]MCS7247534.1 class I SAM-dependent methyltransferase [Anaerolineales bacterium]MDW8161345.1 class I SAM-dependent methyltransferase [Anaerolineales bacterium]MDW8445778.1 class I SAM-dependent methyltransferase [Anaerolineales bacterium]